MRESFCAKGAALLFLHFLSETATFSRRGENQSISSMCQQYLPAACTSSIGTNGEKVKSEHLKEEISQDLESQSTKPVLRFLLFALETQIPSRCQSWESLELPLEGRAHHNIPPSRTCPTCKSVSVPQRRFWMQSLYSLWHTGLTTLTTSCQVLQLITPLLEVNKTVSSCPPSITITWRTLFNLSLLLFLLLLFPPPSILWPTTYNVLMHYHSQFYGGRYCAWIS